MNVKITCRFCLTTISDSEPKNLGLVNEIIKQIFDVLQIHLNVDVSENSAMCPNCLETIKRLLTFKSIYVNIEQIVLKFILSENKAIVDLKDVYKSKNVGSNLDQKADVCRLCMKWSNKADLTPVKTFINDSVFVEMWTKYITEVDLTITEYPKVCLDCKDNIQCYSKFVLDMQTVEGKIYLNRYIETHQDLSQIKLFKCLKCNYETFRKGDLNQHTRIHQDRSKVKKHKCLECSYKASRKNILTRHMIIHQDRSHLKMYKCVKCSFGTIRKGNLTQHARIHQDRSQLKMYECFKCGYETFRRNNLTQHFVVHQNQNELKMYKCVECDYESRRKGGLTRHIRIHQDPSQLEMYECLKCSYQTHRTDYLNRHIKLHQGPRRSRPKIYKCFKCRYDTDKKSNLIRHAKTHQD